MTAPAARAALRVASLAASLAFALACATGHGHFDFDAQASFAAYRSFALVHPKQAAETVTAPTGDVAVSQLVERRVRAALERELAAKGLVAAPEASADLLVAFNVSSRQASRTELYPAEIPHRWPRRWWHEHWDHAYTRIYTEGLMIVDLVDAKTRQLVWRGWTTDPLPSSGDYENVVDHAVHEVMRNYPPAGR